MDKLERAAFREWLASREPQSMVGITRDNHTCPLARYLGPGWQVLSEAAYLDGRPRAYWLPAWARGFVAAVDALPQPALAVRRITGHKALTLLDAVPA